MGIVTATLQVNFIRADADGVDLGANLAMEIDDRSDGLNAGETSFRPGDPVHYLMYLSGASLVQHFATSGAIATVGPGARVVAGDDAEYLSFAEAREARLRYPASGGLTSYEWIGTVYDIDGAPIAAPTVEVVDNGATVRTPEKVTGILKVSYNAPYTAYRLSGVPTDIPQALIFAQASTE